MKKSKDEIQAEALTLILPLKRCGVGATMGSGKTLIGLKHMNANYTDYCRFLVVVPKVSIIEEWKSEAVNFELSYLLPHITFTTYLSLNKQDTDWDCIYFDEGHSLKFSHKIFLDKYNGKILILTGTPPRNSRSEKARMIARYGPIVYSYKIDDAIEDEILNDYNIIVHKLELDETKTLRVKKGNGFFLTSEQKSYDYWTNKIDGAESAKEVQIYQIMRMKAMQSFPSKERLASRILQESGEKIILFANTTAQADKFGVPSYHSKNPDSESNLSKFKLGFITKMSAVQQLSEGITIKGLKEAIIMHTFSGNSPKTKQKMGRLMRLSTTETATLHILCYKDTIDEIWVEGVLRDLDQSKIIWI